jgi:type IV pilus assembly protein PilM
MSDSFWKKEISLGRKKGAPEGEAQPDAVAEPVVPQAAPPVTGAEPKQSMWKKELSFGRKPKDATVAPPAASAEPKQSIWKKDVSLGRKQKDETPELPAAAAPAEASKSMWKKDLSFGRKKQDKEVDRMAEEAAQAVSPEFAPPSSPPVPLPADVPPTAVAEAVVAAMPEPAAPVVSAPVEPAPLEPPVELQAVPPVQAVPSFEPEPVVAAAPLHIAPDPPALVPEPADAGPFELAAVESPAAPEPWEPVALEAVPPEPEPVAAEPFPLEAVPSEPQPLQPAPYEPAHYEPLPVEPAPDGPSPYEPAPAAAAPEQALEPPALDPVPTEPAPLAPLSALSPAVVAASAEVPPAVEPAPVALPPEELPPVESVPAALAPVHDVVEPEHFAPLDAEPVHVAEADPWLASPELPADAVDPATAAFEAGAEPAPAVVHPPVPAAELPPVVAAKGPFWKKELSFSRKKKPDFTAVEAAVAAVAGAPVKKSPWWKKEIGGKKKAPDEVSSGFEEFESPKKPIWKRELSFSRKPKAAPVAVDAAVVAAAVADATAVAKTPWYKKELGGKKKQKDAPADAAVSSPDAPKIPFWKKGLTMPTLSRGGSRTSGGGGSKSSKGSKSLVGLKIGASQLAAARVSNNGVAALEQVARTALPMGIVVGGELRDPDALSEALKAFFAKNKLPRKGVRLGIANNRIGVRVIDIAGVDEEKQLANAIHFRAQEALPIPLDEAVLDYHVLDESFDPEGNSVKRVLLVVAYKELVERYVGACRKAGLTIAGVDLEAFALLRSLSPPADRGTSALVAVAIGFDRSTFAVSDGRFCEFTRVLEWGGQSLNVALARAFNSEPSAVETMKRGLSLDGSTAPEGVSAESNAAAVDVVRKQMQSFARELVSSLQFYQNQPGSLGIGEIAITGGTAQMPGIAEELERLIGVPVRVGNPLARLKVSKRVSMTDDVGSYAVAIGLGIED